MVIKLKRAYEPPESDDGCRVLVDRLWPRGMSKSAARLDLWLKGLAPSATLRQWFGHDPAKWSRFRARYFRELQKQGAAVEQLMAHVRHGTVTLVYGAKDQRITMPLPSRSFSNRMRHIPDAYWVDTNFVPRLIPPGADR